jgi:hypothetical protein
VNTVVMFFSVRTKKLPFRLLQERWLEAARFAGFGIHAPTIVEPKRGRVCVLSDWTWLSAAAFSCEGAA